MRAIIAVCVMICLGAGCQTREAGGPRELFFSASPEGPDGLFRAGLIVDVGGGVVTLGFTLAPGITPAMASRRIEAYLRQIPEAPPREVVGFDRDRWVQSRGEWASVLAQLEGLDKPLAQAISDEDLRRNTAALLRVVHLKRMGSEGVPLLAQTVQKDDISEYEERIALQVLREARDDRAIQALAHAAGDARKWIAFLARESLALTIEPAARGWKAEYDRDEKDNYRMAWKRYEQQIEQWYCGWKNAQSTSGK